MQGPLSNILPDGRRLHLNHGPIDLIIEAWGQDQKQAYIQAENRFQTILAELVDELDLLRSSDFQQLPNGDVARRMYQAVASHKDVFVTPMAAVAGAVADEICSSMCNGLNLDKAYVNNGGDISVYLGQKQSLSAAIHDGRDAGRIVFTHDNPERGLATSGWRGRSHSLGIADAVSVVAMSAAKADVAATLVANAVDLPEHPEIKRQPANQLAPDSDLKDMKVTVGVGQLSENEISAAIRSGEKAARTMLANGTISAASIFLQGQNVLIGGQYFHQIAPANVTP